MPNEISQMMMQCSLEAGELFGVNRDGMLGCLNHPERLDRRRYWFDWEEYVRLMRFVFGHVGTGPELVAAGQRYLNERYRTRSAHLYAQYTTWERALWVAKTLMAGRMMKGYRIDYTEKGEDRFEVTMSIPEHLEDFPDFFYFLTGVWTGSSPQAKLQHTIHSLKVKPHHAVADITFDRRSLESRVVFNPLYSWLKSLWELRCCRREAKSVSLALKREMENLDRAFHAVSNAVFLMRGGEVVMANGNAFELLGVLPGLEAAVAGGTFGSGGGGVEVLEFGGRVFRVRHQVLEGGAGKEWLISLEDCTHLREIALKCAEGPEGIRREAELRLEQNLGGSLESLVALLEEVGETEPEGETKEMLLSLEALARHCRRQGLVLVEGEPPQFVSDAALRAALLDVVREFREVFGFRILVKGDSLPELGGARERGQFFLMIQEVLRNAWRHSGVEEARMEWRGDWIRITDRGRGFSVTALDREGLGMESIRLRAEGLGLRAECVQGGEWGWCFSRPAIVEGAR